MAMAKRSFGISRDVYEAPSSNPASSFLFLLQVTNKSISIMPIFPTLTRTNYFSTSTGFTSSLKVKNRLTESSATPPALCYYERCARRPTKS